MFKKKSVLHLQSCFDRRFFMRSRRILRISFEVTLLASSAQPQPQRKQENKQNRKFKPAGH